jgi:hypothetical protein
MADINWARLFRDAENGPDKPFVGTVEITMAAELAFGYHMSPEEIVVIQDTDGRIWIIYETIGSDGDAPGLVSRYNVRPGMRFRLKISPAQIGTQTDVFCLTPELEGRTKADPRRSVSQ